MNRVIVTNPFNGICGMQVCCVKDATDEEILEVCNRENPSGTENGWGDVLRQVIKDDIWATEKNMPVQCEDYEDRIHIIVLC